MFRGISTINLDAKGRFAIPSRYREQLAETSENQWVLTLNPLDPCLWLYPASEWEIIDEKLKALPDFDQQSRSTKRMMWGYWSECVPDSQGRVLIPQELRDFAGLEKQIAMLGQGNKLEIWDREAWRQQLEKSLEQVRKKTGESSDLLRQLSL